MCAPFHNPSLLHYHYLVSVLYSRQPVGDDNGRTVLHQVGESVLHKPLALSIESRCRLVQNKNRGILQHGPGYGYALTLASGELAATVSDIGIVTMLHLHDELIRIGYSRCPLHILVRYVLHTECDVVADRVIEQYRLLRDHSHQGYEFLGIILADIHSVYEYTSFGDIIEPGQQVRQGGLACA